MDSSTVYIKTARGSEEIASRSHGLSSRARAMLIMVDGRRSAATLLAQSSERTEAESNLAALLDGGFIAAVAPPVAAPPAAPSTQAPVQATLAVDLVTIKHYISSTLHDILGPDADVFTTKVEATKNAQELLTLCEKLIDVIRSVGGKKKAEDFKEKISAMLS